MSIFGPDLFDAAEKGDIDILEWLVKPAIESDINYRRPSRNHVTNTPLCIAASKGHTQAVKILLSNPHINVNANVPDNIYGWALGWACQRRDGADLIGVLASHHSVDLNKQDLCGRTVLMVAASCCIENVRALLRFDGIRVFLKNNVGQTAFDLAEGDEIKMLIRSYAKGTLATSTSTKLLTNDSSPFAVASVQPEVSEEYQLLLEQVRCARFYGIWLKKTEELSRSKDIALAAEQMTQAALFGQRIDLFRGICVDTPELQVLTAAEYHMLPDRVTEAIERLKEECRTLAKQESYVEMERVAELLKLVKQKHRSLPRQLIREAGDPPLSPAAVATILVENENLRTTNATLKTAVDELHGTIADLTIELRALRVATPPSSSTRSSLSVEEDLVPFFKLHSDESRSLI